MIIATLKEVKDNENRVGLTPYGVRELVDAGHEVIVQECAGLGSGFSDTEYKESGARIMREAREIVQEADIIVKVKEPIAAEYALLEQMAGKILYTYLHLSGVDPELTQVLLRNNITAIAYETLEDEHGRLPLLAPMSEVAGVLAVQYGAEYLQKKYGGRGVTMGVISGTGSARVVIVGGGYVGMTAAKTAAGMGSRVKLFDINPARVAELNKEMADYLGPVLSKNFEAIVPEGDNFNEALREANVVIGAVLVAGTKAPEVISEEQVKSMKEGTVIVDVSIDQGGCIWGSRATSHSDPVYELYGKIYCCVTNMPGQVSRQSTMALTNATLPYLKMLAKGGAEATLRQSLSGDGRMARGLNTYRGHVTYASVAKDLGIMDVYVPVEEALN